MTSTNLIIKAVSSVGFSCMALGCYGVLRRIKAINSKLYVHGNLLIKLSVPLIIFLIAKIQLSGDLLNYYLPQSEHVAQGLVPIRDFKTSYGPLFPVIVFGLRQLGGWPCYFMFLAAVDALVLVLVFKSLPLEKHLAVFCIWAFNPLIIWTTSILGQQQILVMAFVIAIAFLAPRKPLMAGFVLAAGSLCAKLFFVAFLPLVGGIRRTNLIDFVKFALPFGVTFLLLRLYGINLEATLLGERSRVCSGNLPFILICLFQPWLNGDVVKTVFQILFLVISTGIFMYLKKLPYQPDLASLVVVAGALFLALNPRSYTIYLMFILPLVVVCVLRQKLAREILWVGLLLVGSTMAVLEESALFVLREPPPSTLVPLSPAGIGLLVFDAGWLSILFFLATQSLKSSDPPELEGV